MTKQRTLWALIAATCILVAGQVQAQPLVPICDIRVDANGDCITDALDENVCIQGVVIAWKQFGVRGAGAILDSDSDCAISIFDITDAPEARSGDQVVLLGKQGDDCITVSEFAQWAGCLEYEVTCRVSARVPRIYHG